MCGPDHCPNTFVTLGWQRRRQMVERAFARKQLRIRASDRGHLRSAHGGPTGTGQGRRPESASDLMSARMTEMKTRAAHQRRPLNRALD